jgi:ribosome-binding factor A
MSRADRVAELIKAEVSDIITRKLNDPRVGFTSITSVNIGSDLHNAVIYVSVLGDEKQKVLTLRGLEHASNFIRHELGQRLQLRDVPEVHFKHDASIEKAAKVFEIINKLHQETRVNKKLKVTKKPDRRSRRAKSNKRNK